MRANASHLDQRANKKLPNALINKLAGTDAALDATVKSQPARAASQNQVNNAQAYVHLLEMVEIRLTSVAGGYRNFGRNILAMGNGNEGINAVERHGRTIPTSQNSGNREEIH
jgi:hypothetical protein